MGKKKKEMGIPDYLTCFLRNLYAGQEATVRTGHGTTDWVQTGKGICQGCILSPAYLTYMQSSSREILDWMKHKLESRLPAEISTLFSIVAVLVCIPTNSVRGFPFLHTLSSIYCL